MSPFDETFSCFPFVKAIEKHSRTRIAVHARRLSLNCPCASQHYPISANGSHGSPDRIVP